MLEESGSHEQSDNEGQCRLEKSTSADDARFRNRAAMYAEIAWPRPEKAQRVKSLVHRAKKKSHELIRAGLIQVQEIAC